jgi:hypothetical protein
MPIHPHREYTLAALAGECDVPLAVLREAVRRHRLPAVPGPGGRGGKWRVLGANFLAWQRERHGGNRPAPRVSTVVGGTGPEMLARDKAEAAARRKARQAAQRAARAEEG